MKVKKLAKLVNRLQDWIDSMEGLFCAPIPNFEYIGEVFKVRVGNFVVWDSFNDGNHPTFKKCKKRFLEFVGQFNHSCCKDLDPCFDEPPSDIPQGHIEIQCVYFRDSGRYYSEGKGIFSAEIFKGCVLPKDYGVRLNRTNKLPNLDQGEWNGPFIVSVLSSFEDAVVPELVLPVLT